MGSNMAAQDQMSSLLIPEVEKKSAVTDSRADKNGGMYYVN